MVGFRSPKRDETAPLRARASDTIVLRSCVHYPTPHPPPSPEPLPSIPLPTSTPTQVLELFGVEGDEDVSLLSSSGGPNNINSGGADGDDAGEEEVVEPGPSRVFFCAALACASAFAAMAMTSWSRTDG